MTSFVNLRAVTMSAVSVIAILLSACSAPDADKDAETAPAGTVEPAVTDQKPAVQNPTDIAVAAPKMTLSLNTKRLLKVVRPKDGVVASDDGTGVVFPAATAMGDAPFIPLAEKVEAAASGNTVVVQIRAKAVADTGRMAVAYFTNEVGNSGAREFDLGSDYADYAFEYDVAPMVEGKRELIRFVTDLDGDGSGVIVSDVKVIVK